MISPVPGFNFSKSYFCESIKPVFDKLNIFSSFEIDSLNLFFRKDSSR